MKTCEDIITSNKGNREFGKIASKNVNVVYVYVLTNWAIDLGCW